MLRLHLSTVIARRLLPLPGTLAGVMCQSSLFLGEVRLVVEEAAFVHFVSRRLYSRGWQCLWGRVQLVGVCYTGNWRLH